MAGFSVNQLIWSTPNGCFVSGAERPIKHHRAYLTKRYGSLLLISQNLVQASIGKPRLSTCRGSMAMDETIDLLYGGNLSPEICFTSLKKFSFLLGLTSLDLRNFPHGNFAMSAAMGLEMFLMTLPQDASQAEIACIAHNSNGSFPAGGKQDWKPRSTSGIINPDLHEGIKKVQLDIFKNEITTLEWSEGGRSESLAIKLFKTRVALDDLATEIARANHSSNSVEITRRASAKLSSKWRFRKISMNFKAKRHDTGLSLGLSEVWTSLGNTTLLTAITERELEQEILLCREARAQNPILSIQQHGRYTRVEEHVTHFSNNGFASISQSRGGFLFEERMWHVGPLCHCPRELALCSGHELAPMLDLKFAASIQ
ncbi:hypothetical protein Tco_0551794 [Tanacetum coccineum]